MKCEFLAHFVKHITVCPLASAYQFALRELMRRYFCKDLNEVTAINFRCNYALESTPRLFPNIRSPSALSDNKDATLRCKAILQFGNGQSRHSELHSDVVLHVSPIEEDDLL